MRTAVVIALIVTGCGSDESKPYERSIVLAPKPAPTAHGVTHHMKDHFTQVDVIKDAPALGDTAATRVPAT